MLFAGRIEPAKGLCSLIYALGRLKRSQRPLLVVAGRGPDEARARKLADSLTIDVEWAGWLKPQALRAAIDSATAICIPSLWPEPFGLVGIEAQGRGRPAVAYDVGSIGDWLGDAGIAVPRGDEDALARALLDIVDPLQWPLRSLRAQRRAERYRLSAHIDLIERRLLPMPADLARAVRR